MRDVTESQEWLFQYGDEGFAVTVKHWWRAPAPAERIVHKWNVYVYIYPTHPLHKTFNGDGLFQDAICEMPLPRTCSFCRTQHNNKGEPQTIEVGVDYAHLCDDHIKNFATREDAIQMFRDADILIDYMMESAKPAA